MLLHQTRRAFIQKFFQAYTVNEIKWIQYVALGLGHLLAVLVANQAVNINFVKRHIAHELDAHHDHACDPEENDVEAGDEHITGIKLIKRIRLLGPAKRTEWPERRREPRVQDIFVLFQGMFPLRLCF